MRSPSHVILVIWNLLQGVVVIFPKLVTGLLTVLGLGGIEDDLRVWERWLLDETIVRLIALVFLGAGVFLLFLIWHRGRQSNASAPQPRETVVPQDPPKTVGHSFTMGNYNTTGAIHVGDVVNQAPKPELRPLSDIKTVLLPDGRSAVEVMFEVVAPYPPANLEIRVYGTELTKLEVVPQRSGLSMFGHTGVRPEMSFTNIQQPYGRYLLKFTCLSYSHIWYEFG